MKASVLVGVLCAATSLHAQAPAGPAANAAVCTLVQTLQPLPVEVRETSGLVRGRANADVLWTHNDSGNQPELFAIGADRGIRARVAVRGVPFTDWEDLEGGACGSASCLYVADIGDNQGSRKQVSIYEIEEPQLPAHDARVLRVINARYLDGPQDAEALFRLPNGEIYIVTKGRQKAISVYRLSAAGAGDVATLQPVRDIAERPSDERDRVTAATASADGRFVAIRSYRSLWLYRTDDLLGSGAPVAMLSLAPLQEKQGEALAFDADGTLWLTSEAEQQPDLPTIASVRCKLE